jgi:hypothetical protein
LPSKLGWIGPKKQGWPKINCSQMKSLKFLSQKLGMILVIKWFKN